jgi:hypothetical protein
LNGSVNEKSLCHVWLIGFDCLNQLPGTQQGRSKQDGVLSFLSHGNPAIDLNAVEAGEGILHPFGWWYTSPMSQKKEPP